MDSNGLSAERVKDIKFAISWELSLKNDEVARLARGGEKLLVHLWRGDGRCQHDEEIVESATSIFRMIAKVAKEADEEIGDICETLEGYAVQPNELAQVVVAAESLK